MLALIDAIRIVRRGFRLALLLVVMITIATTGGEHITGVLAGEGFGWGVPNLTSP